MRGPGLNYESIPKEVRDQLERIKTRLISEGVSQPSQHNDYCRVYRAWQRSSPIWKEWQKGYYTKNRERIIAHQKGYADRNVEKLKDYRKRNSESRVRTTHAWRQKNPEHHKAVAAKWRKANMPVIRMHIALRRARERSATIGNPKEIALWEKEWKSRPTNTCEWCRMETPTELCQSDHAEPLILGGGHNLDNLVIACKSCNARKRAKPLSKWLAILEADLDRPTAQTSPPL